MGKKLNQPIEIRIVLDPAKRDSSLPILDSWPVIQANLIAEFGNAMIEAEKTYQNTMSTGPGQPQVDVEGDEDCVHEFVRALNAHVRKCVHCGQIESRWRGQVVGEFTHEGPST